MDKEINNYIGLNVESKTTISFMHREGILWLNKRTHTTSTIIHAAQVTEAVASEFNENEIHRVLKVIFNRMSIQETDVNSTKYDKKVTAKFSSVYNQ